MVRVLDIQKEHALDFLWRGYYIYHTFVWHCSCPDTFSLAACLLLQPSNYTLSPLYADIDWQIFPPHHNCHRSDNINIHSQFGIQVTSRSPMHDFTSPNYPFLSTSGRCNNQTRYWLRTYVASPIVHSCTPFCTCPLLGCSSSWALVKWIKNGCIVDIKGAQDCA